MVLSDAELERLRDRLYKDGTLDCRCHGCARTVTIVLGKGPGMWLHRVDDTWLMYCTDCWEPLCTMMALA